MIRIIAASFVLLIALGANAALYFRDVREPQPQNGAASVDIGGISLDVPRLLMRDAAQFAGGRLERVDIALTLPDFAPLPPPSPRKPNAVLPPHLSLIIRSAMGMPSASQQFQALYARFLARETEAVSNGLVKRRFRKETPYDDRVLYIGAGTGTLFIVLCPAGAGEMVEPCITRLKAEGLDLELRFPVAFLDDWRRISSEATRRVAEWRRP